MQKQANYCHAIGKKYRFQKKSSFLDESLEFAKSLFIILFFTFAFIQLIDYTIASIPQLNYISINHCKIIKKVNIAIPYIFEKFRKGSKTNTKKVCACAAIIAGLLSMNVTLSIWGLFSLKKAYDNIYSDSNYFVIYHKNGKYFGYKI